MGILVDHSRAHKKIRKHSRLRILWISLAVLVVLLIGARLALTPWLLRTVNQKFDEIPDYDGHIDDLDIHLFRGAYRVQGIELTKSSGKVPVPFFKAEAVDISVQWKGILKGKVVSEIYVHKPELNFVMGPRLKNGKVSKERSQTGIDPSWTDKVKAMAPFDVNKFIIKQGQIHYRDFSRTPKVDVHLDHIEAQAYGLTNAPGSGDSLPASFHAVFRAMGHADGRINMKIAPLERNPTFDVDAELKGLNLPTLNDFFKAYARVDVEKGTFSMFTEAAAANGRFKGYVKPVMRDMEILDVEEDSDNPLKLLWETVVAGVAEVFENQTKEQTATQIPFAGRFDDPKASIWAMVGELLRNAFIRALQPSLSKTIDVGDVGGLPKPSKSEKKEHKKNVK